MSTSEEAKDDLENTSYLESPSLQDIKQAARNIASKAIKSPLVKLNQRSRDGNGKDIKGPEIYLKLENLQPIGSFKVRPAVNAISCIDDQERLRKSGVCTASAGNFAQGLAWCCMELEIQCTVFTPDTAPEIKVNAIRSYGASVVKVPYTEWWEMITTHKCPQCPDAIFIHPGAEPAALAGNATIALEIVEELPDVDCIVVPYGSGSVCTGIACGIRALAKEEGHEQLKNCKVFAAEPETAAPFALSKKMGKPCEFKNYEPSFVDGCGGKSVLSEMWPLANQVIDGGCSVQVKEIASAIKMLAEGNKIIAEGAGACPVAAVLSGLCGNDAKKIVCVVCGGGIDNDKLATILRGEVPENASNIAAINFEDQLKALDYSLPSAPEPKGCYTPAVIVGNFLYTSGHGPVLPDGKSYITGRIGNELTVEDGVDAARRTGLAILSTLRYKLGSLNSVKRLVKSYGMVNAHPDAIKELQCVQIINGYSQLMLDVFGGELGVGTRSAVGVATLPANTPVEIEAVFELKSSVALPPPISQDWNLDSKIDKLDLALPKPSKPAGFYTPAVISNGYLYTSGHGPSNLDGKTFWKGQIGTDLSVNEGIQAARATGLSMLATIQDKVGSFNSIKRVVKTLGLVNADPDTIKGLECVQVINGFSQLMSEIFGYENGIGARSAVGVNSLPFNIPVEIEAIFELEQNALMVKSISDHKSEENVDENFEKLNLSLPPAPIPGGCYTPCVIANNNMYISGHVPLLDDGKSMVKGQIGVEIDIQEAVNAAKLVGLAMLATIKKKLGSLNRVRRLVKVLGMVNGKRDTILEIECITVVNGFSQLMMDVFGEECGIGARSAFSNGVLPNNIPVKIEAIFELKDSLDY